MYAIALQIQHGGGFCQPIRSRIKNSRWRHRLGNSVQQRNLVAVVMAVAMAVLMVVLIGVVVTGVVTGPLHLLSENGDLSFETELGRELSGEVSKKFMSSFYF